MRFIPGWILLFFGLFAVTLAVPATKSPCCPRHEVFTECGSTCPATCRSILERNVNRRVCPDICVRGCVCRDGYVRSADGKCIPPEQCGLELPGEGEEPGIECHGRNEVFSACGSACPETCDSLKLRYKNRICTLNCVIGCTCREGYVRNREGECVLPHECPRYPKDDTSVVIKDRCGCNEVLSTCASPCPETCDMALNPDKPRPPCVEICLTGCVCRDGYVRNEDGKCVQISQCPKPECGDNEEFTDCGSACPETCDTFLGVVPRRPCLKRCVVGCFCKDGYVRDSRDVCVQPSECPVCPPNEAFKSCGTACPETCETIRQPDVIRPCTKNCVIGCACQDGFVRDLNGRCVLPSECPETSTDDDAITVSVPVLEDVLPETIECGLNEVFKDCETACPDTCDNYLDKKPRACTKNCIIGCACQDGFVRNKAGQCVPPSQCPNSNSTTGDQECGPNEYYTDCGSACPETCDSISASTGPSVCIALCVSGCFCQNGFVRNQDGVCVPPSQCPNVGTSPTTTVKKLVQPFEDAIECGKNEVFSSCGSACPQTCDTVLGLDQSLACPAVCRIGCVCQPGYVRNKDGACVLPSECPNPTGSTPSFEISTPACGQNEVFSLCGTVCPTTCDTILGLTDNRVCPEICQIGCVCQDGYVRNQKGLCVAPSQCPKPRCLPNEEYLECGSACPRTCDNVLNPNIQIRCINKCVAGCFCKEGLVRHQSGRCVRPKQCRVVKIGFSAEASDV